MASVVTVVSGTYNRLERLKRMIASARASVPIGITLDFILVDGGSTDGTVDWLKTQTDVTIVEHGELKGAINAFTEGASLSHAKYTLLANDDITFIGDSILKAVMHLEHSPTCGGVAFADNRYNRGEYRVMNMSARLPDGNQVFLPYAQVGLFRTWLGERLSWWRGKSEQNFTARTYAGDNLLTANILETGYTVDAVDYVMIEDYFEHDALREKNNAPIAEGESKRVSDLDAESYYSVFPIDRGPVVQPFPLVANPDKRAMRILYLPIYEPGPSYELQKTTKYGLRDALARVGLVYEYDYVGRFHMQKASRDVIASELFEILAKFKPDLMLSQFHAADIVTAPMLRDLRAAQPNMVVVNWNGDAWDWSLTGAEIIALLQNVDLQLAVNPHVFAEYTSRSIPHAYWFIGYETARAHQLPDVSAHDVLFLGNHYGQVMEDGENLTMRGKFARMLRSITGVNVGIYGHDWDKAGVESDGATLYDFATGEALMKKAKIVVGDNQFLTHKGFISNRIVQTLGAGAFLLHQIVYDLEELLGIKDGVHYVSFTDYDDAKEKIDYYLKKPAARKKIAKAGHAFVSKYHSFDARVLQLFAGQDGKPPLLSLARRSVGNTITLRYVGPRDDSFGINVQGTQYEVKPGNPLVMERSHADLVLAKDSALYQVVGAGIG